MGKPIDWYKPCGACGARHHVADGGLCMTCYVAKQDQIAFDAEAARLGRLEAQRTEARAEGYAAGRRDAAAQCEIERGWCERHASMSKGHDKARHEGGASIARQCIKRIESIGIADHEEKSDG